MYTLEQLESTPEFLTLPPDEQENVRTNYKEKYGNLELWADVASSEEFAALPFEEQHNVAINFDERFGGNWGTKFVDQMPQPERTILGTAKDLGISALKGSILVGESIQGLIDIPTQGRFGYLTEQLGYRPEEAREILDTFYTDAQKYASKQVSEEEGFLNTVKAMMKYPSTAVHGAVETAPLMGAGGVVGRGILSVAPKVPAIAGAAFGEGAVAGGLAAEQVRQESDTGLITGKQSIMSLLSGIGTGAFAIAGGRLAKKLGFADIDTMLVSGDTGQTANSIIKRIVGGGITEGVFEELPQSAQEQVWQNAMQDKPLLDGVPETSAQGMVIGGLMGSGVNIVTTLAPRPEPEPPKPEEILGEETLEGALEVFDKSVRTQTEEDLVPDQLEGLALAIDEIATMTPERLDAIPLEQINKDNPYIGQKMGEAVDARFAELERVTNEQAETVAPTGDIETVEPLQPDIDRGIQPEAPAGQEEVEAASIVDEGETEIIPEEVASVETPADQEIEPVPEALETDEDIQTGRPPEEIRIEQKAAGKVGGMLASGEVVKTVTGRETTPFPKVDTGTHRKALNTVKRVDAWLVRNAIEEAESRKDEFNLLQFKDINLKNISQSDKDGAEQYLFGEEQPPVVPPLTKPLAGRPLEKIKVKQEFRNEDTGQVETVFRDAPVVLAESQGEIEKYYEVLGCLQS